MDIYIRNFNGTLLGEISDFESIERERNYYSYSKLVLRVVSSSENVEKLRIGNVLYLSDDINYGYLIEHFSLVKEGKREILEIYGVSMNYILSFRTFLRQESRSGNVETVVKNFISNNFIDSNIAARNISNLSISPNNGINDNVTVSAFGSDIMTFSFETLRDFESSIDLLFNPITSNYDVTTFKGVDRSISQNINNHVIFSTEYDNLLNREYTIDRLTHKNVSVVGGEGEGINRKIEIVGNESGIQRREQYIDARDLQSIYSLPNGTTVTLTPEEYTETLITRGLSTINDLPIIENFQSTIDNFQFVVGRDFNIGDKVTFYDPLINVTLNLRVTQIITSINIEGIQIIPSFGTNLPNNLI